MRRYFTHYDERLGVQLRLSILAYYTLRKNWLWVMPPSILTVWRWKHWLRAWFRESPPPMSRNIFMEGRPHDYREITKQEAKDILKQCHQNGLIHTIVKWQHDFYAICNCCSCCCVPLRLLKKYGIGNALVREDNIVEKLRGRQFSQSLWLSDGY